jgi:hypothetical protein
MKRAVLGQPRGVRRDLGAAVAQNQTDSDQHATAAVAAAINVTTVSSISAPSSELRPDDPVHRRRADFQVDGAANAEVSLTFSILPTDLSDGTNLLPVTFTSRHNTAADPTGGTTFDPAVGEPGTNLDATTGQLHVYVGGTVTAAGTQPSGTYTALVQLTAAYTGN